MKGTFGALLVALVVGCGGVEAEAPANGCAGPGCSTEGLEPAPIRCAGIDGCLIACEGDGACEQVCFDRAGELQTRRWQDLADCVAEHACVDGPCYEEHCLAELRACVAP